MIALAETHVTIVGLGLMGGSLAGALRGHCRHVTGVDIDAATVATAERRGFVDHAATDLAAGVREADLVILATPVRTILHLLGEIGPLLKPGAILMDLGSTKAQITAKMAASAGARRAAGRPSDVRQGARGHRRRRSGALSRRDLHPHAAGAHHRRGLRSGARLSQHRGRASAAADAGSAGCAHRRRQPSALPAGLRLSRRRRHRHRIRSAAWEIAAGGFRDTSRVAGSDVTMMLDILLTNREHVLKALTTALDQLQRFAALIDEGDEPALRALLEGIRAQRKEIIS